jgi:hypothetical protein
MKPDDPPPGAPASPEAPPPASLTNVRLRGRAQPEAGAKPPVKRGDLTQQLQAEPAAPPPPEPARTTPKRGDLTQQLEAAARKTGAAPAAPAAKPAAPPPSVAAKPKIEAPLERKPVAAKAEPPAAAPPPVERKPAPEPVIERKPAAAPAPERKVEPPVEAKAAMLPKAAPSLERKPASVKAEPPPPPPPPAAAESAPLGQDDIDALFDSLPAPTPAVEREPAAAEPAEIAAAAEVEPAASPEPPVEETHAHLSAGSELGEDDVRALLDPPGRRPMAASPPPVAEPEIELEEPEAEPEETAAAEPPSAVAETEHEEAPELRLVVDTPDLAAESEPEAPPAAAAAPAPQPASGNSVDEIIDYWDSLRGDRRYPMLGAIDRSHVSQSWPNCLLVSFVSATGDTAQPRMTRIGEANGQVEYTAMVIDWIIKCGRQSVKRSEPMEEEKRFPVTGGNARYQLLLLPLSSTEGKADYVLAHLCKVKELSAGAAFKRWLAS